MEMQRMENTSNKSEEQSWRGTRGRWSWHADTCLPLPARLVCMVLSQEAPSAVPAEQLCAQPLSLALRWDFQAPLHACDMLRGPHAAWHSVCVHRQQGHRKSTVSQQLRALGVWRGVNAWSCAINRATCMGLGNSPLLGPSGLPPPALLDTDSRSHIGWGTKRGVLGPTVWTGRSRGHQGQTRGGGHLTGGA